MFTNQLNNICNGIHFFVCSFTRDMLIYKYFSRFLLRFVLQLSIKKFSQFYELLFPENLLVAAANRFKVLKIFMSLKVTVYIQYRRLRSKKALDARVLNGNLIVLKWQNIHVISNIKYTATYVQQNLAKQFTFSRGVFRTLSNV